MLKKLSSPFLLKTCEYCGFKLLHDEVEDFCCGRGKRVHRLWANLPSELIELYSTPGFSDISRLLNTLFCTAVLHSGNGEPGFTYHVRGGPPAMRFQGTLYARMMRTSEHCWFVADSKFGQGYADLSPAQKAIALQIAKFLVKFNPLSSITFAANELLQSPCHTKNLPLRNDIVEGQVYLGENTDTEALCAVFLGPGGLAPSRLATFMVLGSRNAINETSPLWEVILYPLFHPCGLMTSTWRPGYTSQGGRVMTITEYLRSVLLHQPHFWKCARLAHQYILDTYARSEQINAQVWASNTIQNKIRQSILEITGRVAPEGKIYLPASVPGSEKYQQRFMHDAMHITGVYGNPHLFITMTANPNWPEIHALLPPGQRASDRPDIINRVFKQKRKQLMLILKTPNALFPGHLGLQYCIGVTEFQKCQLPHTHMAVRLDVDTIRVPMKTVQDHLNLMDHLISAQLPQEGTEDYDLITTFMLHNGVCDERCKIKRKDGTYGCRFYFPKPENEVPRLDRKGFAQYRRKKCDVRVVPHILKIIRELKCHVNTEWTFGSGCVSYLYKYFSKPLDSTGIKVSEATDEIFAHRSVRLLTVSEAVYRTFGYCINFRDPAVTLCRFTTPKQKNNEAVQDFLAGDDMQAIFHEEGLLAPDAQFEDHDGNLKDYFVRPAEAENCTFTDFFAAWYRVEITKIPRQTVLRVAFDMRGNAWLKRQRPQLARMHYIPRYAGEAYFLRLLLLELSARSYDDLYGPFSSFRDHAYDLGLEQAPIHNISALKEAIREGASSYKLRRLYVLMAIHCGGMTGCWETEEIRNRMVYDFQPDSRKNEDWPQVATEALCLMDMISIAESMGHTLILESHGLARIDDSVEGLTELRSKVGNHHALMRFAEYVGVRFDTATRTRDYQSEVRRHWSNISASENTEVGLEQRIDNLNREQKIAFLALKSALVANTGGWFHVDAPAGCGKTYLCETLLKFAASELTVGLACASTGIAALQYEQGRTAHNLFKLPLNHEKDIMSGKRAASTLTKLALDGSKNARLELLKAAKLIVWDEIGMIHRVMFEAVDDLLRAVMQNDSPFGGKLFITLGDWRQVCPVDNSRAARFFSENPTAFSTSAFQSSVLSSPLWLKANVLHLHKNERAREDPEFHRKLMEVGNGQTHSIDLKGFGLQITTSFDHAITWLFENDSASPYDPDFYAKHAFLSPYNAEVDTTNEWCSRRMEALRKVPLTCVKSRDTFSTDSKRPDQPIPPPPDPEEMLEQQVRENINALNEVDLQLAGNMLPRAEAEEIFGEPERDAPMDFSTIVQNTNLSADTFTTEVFGRQDFPGVPSHCLVLCPGMVVVLLRNLDHAKGLLNGSRLIIVKVGRNILLARQAGNPLGEVHFIPRIKFDIQIGGVDSRITRVQYPVRPAYAVTVHKSQACTLNRVVIDLRKGVFDHGQLYVALSRVRKATDLLLLLCEGQDSVENIVFSILLEVGRSIINT